eukprot:TRINITY_DN6676_c0_g1_i10.p1 TRINITY_DN6676_c0_g1~~TRINITY_DN6676_c0_g1_i10.p1  ORF type:complete len:200 (+),score=27.14 TRINITY_DN6676_c0_g1_i10:173-772(+)
MQLLIGVASVRAIQKVLYFGRPSLPKSIVTLSRWGAHPRSMLLGSMYHAIKSQLSWSPGVAPSRGAICLANSHGSSSIRIHNPVVPLSFVIPLDPKLLPQAISCFFTQTRRSRHEQLLLHTVQFRAEAAPVRMSQHIRKFLLGCAHPYGLGVHAWEPWYLSLIHISEPTRLLSISYAVFCLKKKKKEKKKINNQNKVKK